ncbi:MAG TPA: SDR family oxidoreductase, partial [Chthoniobacteraceae bacterium]|nr:SDR family oxidoreductase [Chthoniobacteraceae bacterium]
RYLEWLCKLDSKTDSPLPVCYRFDGSPDVDEELVAGVRGYRDSLPVRYGNRAAKQTQSGSFGFLLDCARIYFDEGGKWEKRFWRLIQRAADHVCSHWRQEDNGIWELPEKAHYVASKVMCWVVLERASHIARETGYYEESARWLKVADEIYAEVMDKGWCESKQSFRQRYGSDALDAASLLIPLMEFLPIDHPRVLTTVEALERELAVGGLLHRFDPANTPGCGGDLPTGEFEGAFLPCVFWHAHTLAKMGRCDEAEAILARCEKIAGDTGLFAEEIDAKTNAFLGNMPLLFAHVEYVRAVVELHKARKKTTVKTMKTPHQPRVIVITGAAGGVGRAAARMFAKTEGAHIGLLARGQEALEAAKREVEELGGKAVVLPCDVADADAMEAAAARVEAELGPIDVWVNVAMTSVFAFVIDTTPAEFKRVTEVCYLGYVNGTLAALKRMLPRNRGHIVQVGSALAYRGIPLQAAYCASKHAIQGFMDSLRAELIHKKSRVVATMVQMPALNTPQFDWCRNKMPRKAQPVPPIYQPEVAAKAIVFASKSNRREIYVGMPT